MPEVSIMIIIVVKRKHIPKHKESMYIMQNTQTKFEFGGTVKSNS